MEKQITNCACDLHYLAVLYVKTNAAFNMIERMNDKRDARKLRTEELKIKDRK